MTAILAAMADHYIPIHDARAIGSLIEYIYIRARKDELWVLVMNQKWLTGMSYVCILTGIPDEETFPLKGRDMM